MFLVGVIDCFMFVGLWVGVLVCLRVLVCLYGDCVLGISVWFWVLLCLRDLFVVCLYYLWLDLCNSSDLTCLSLAVLFLILLCIVVDGLICIVRLLKLLFD